MTGCLLPLVSRLTRLGQARPDPLLPALRSPRDRGELAAAEAAAFSARMMFLPSLCFCPRFVSARGGSARPPFVLRLRGAWPLPAVEATPGAATRPRCWLSSGSARVSCCPLMSGLCRAVHPIRVRRFFFSGTGSGEAMPGRDHRSWLRSWLCAQALDLCPGRSSDGSFAVPGLEFRFGPATCCPRSRSAKHA